MPTPGFQGRRPFILTGRSTFGSNHLADGRRQKSNFVKTTNYLALVITGCLCLLVLTGCQNGGGNFSGSGGVIKTLGVYTTRAVSPELDLPGPAYLSQASFGFDETPAAVVIGYGTRGQQQLMTLEVTESATGRSLLSADFYASYGKVHMQPIPIRLSGDYTVRLLGDGRQWDACGFTVLRRDQEGQVRLPGAGEPTRYCQGINSISVKSREKDPLLFGGYDSRLVYQMLNAIAKDRHEKHAELFAQRFPGCVVIQCRLDQTGELTAQRIVANSMDDACGRALRETLQNRSPYPVWPEDLHRKLGADYRELTLTINFN